MGLKHVTRNFINSKLKKNDGLLTNKMIPKWIDKESVNKKDIPHKFVYKDNIQVIEVGFNVQFVYFYSFKCLTKEGYWVSCIVFFNNFSFIIHR